MSKHAVIARGGRRRFSPLVIGAGVAAAVALALSFSGTLSAFTVDFLHQTNTVSTASVSIVETTSDGKTVTCAPSSGRATCTDQNLYGGQTLRPGGVSTASVSFTNTGTTTPSTLSMRFGPCTVTVTATGASSDGKLCDAVTVSLKWRSQTYMANDITATMLANTTKAIDNLPKAGETATADFTVTLAQSAGDDTSGLTLTQPITWTFTA